MSFNGSMFNASAIESSGSAVVDDNIGDLGDVADARTKPEGDEAPEEVPLGDEAELTEEQKEQAKLELEKANEGKTPEEIEAAKKAAESERVKTPEEIAADKKAVEELAIQEEEIKTAKIKADARKEFLKEMGVNTEEELKLKLAGPAKELTPEEKLAKEEQYSANLLSYATKNNLLKTEEFVSLVNIKKTADTDLAYADFATQYKDLNKDRKDEDSNPSPVTEEETREAFNQLYHVDSQDETLKKIGEKQIKIAADQKRNELEQKFNNAKESFDDWSYRDANSKPFISFITTSVKEAIPQSLEFEGNDGTKINFPLDTVDVEEIKKLFINNAAFDEYLDKGASQPAKEQIAKTVEAYLFHKNKDAIIKTVRDISYEAGVKKGGVGAAAPFTKEPKQSAEVPAGDKQLSASEKQKLQQSFSSPFGRV